MLCRQDGDTLYLRNSSDKTTDYVTVPALTYNTVYARETDGADTWKILTGTPVRTTHLPLLLSGRTGMTRPQSPLIR